MKNIEKPYSNVSTSRSVFAYVIYVIYVGPRHESCPAIVPICSMEIPRVHQGVKAHVDQMWCPRHQLREEFCHRSHLLQQLVILGGFGEVNQEMNAERVPGTRSQG